MSNMTRTVLKDSLLDITTNYTSGPLTVGDCYELAIDIDTVVIAGSATLTLSRIDAFNKLYQLYTTTITSTGKTSIDTGPTYNYTVDRAFGDLIQLDVVMSGTSPNISATISIKGKG